MLINFGRQVHCPHRPRPYSTPEQVGRHGGRHQRGARQAPAALPRAARRAAAAGHGLRRRPGRHHARGGLRQPRHAAGRAQLWRGGKRWGGRGQGAGVGRWVAAAGGGRVESRCYLVGDLLAACFLPSHPLTQVAEHLRGLGVEPAQLARLLRRCLPLFAQPVAKRAGILTAQLMGLGLTATQAARCFEAAPVAGASPHGFSRPFEASASYRAVESGCAAWAIMLAAAAAAAEPSHSPPDSPTTLPRRCTPPIGPPGPGIAPGGGFCELHRRPPAVGGPAGAAAGGGGAAGAAGRHAARTRGAPAAAGAEPAGAGAWGVAAEWVQSGCTRPLPAALRPLPARQRCDASHRGCISSPSTPAPPCPTPAPPRHAPPAPQVAAVRKDALLLTVDPEELDEQEVGWSSGGVQQIWWGWRRWIRGGFAFLDDLRLEGSLFCSNSTYSRVQT